MSESTTGNRIPDRERAHGLALEADAVETERARAEQEFKLLGKLAMEHPGDADVIEQELRKQRAVEDAEYANPATANAAHKTAWTVHHDLTAPAGLRLRDPYKLLGKYGKNVRETRAAVDAHYADR